ncbi:RNA binding motif protein 11 [Engraulis encrasicolus]|uniref:RNA binding motif protein 11 n=1 Tax=Engraulis encrasicolus TaxID=184585 RepID=UPI002FD1BD54
MTMPVDSSDANGTVFVGNLDPLVKEEILFELFLQAGPVRRVTIARDREGRQRTFGFVLYKHAEAVPYAIALLNGISLYGRPLKLDFSNESTHDTSSLGSPGTEDRGPNAGRRVVCPQTSTLNGFNFHGDSRSQDQTPGRNLLGNCRPSPLPHLTHVSQHQASPLTPLLPPQQQQQQQQQHPLLKLPPHPFFSPFSTSTPGPLQPWPPFAFWASSFSPLLPMMTPPLREQEQQEQQQQQKQQQQEQERGGEAGEAGGATPKLGEKEREAPAKEQEEQGHRRNKRRRKRKQMNRQTT